MHPGDGPERPWVTEGGVGSSLDAEDTGELGDGGGDSELTRCVLNLENQHVSLALSVISFEHWRPSCTRRQGDG